MDQLIKDFNDTLLSLAENLAVVCPNSIVSNNIKLVRIAINTPNNKVLFIETFILKILKYKNEIKKGDENFFLNKSYEDDLSGDNNKLLSYIFEFKSIWKNLNSQNKKTFIEYLSILCDLAEEYFLIIEKLKK